MSKKGFWFDLYGPQSDDFIEGVIAGVEMYAIWKNGQQVVGIMETPLEIVTAEIKEQLGYNLSVKVRNLIRKYRWVKDIVEV